MGRGSLDSGEGPGARSLELGRNSVIDQQELTEAAQEELARIRTGKVKLSVDERQELVGRIIGMGTT
jgi:hypothetical protein